MDPAQPQFQDMTLFDVDTGEPFIFTAKEQEFFARQGFTNPPKYSSEKRKRMRDEQMATKPFWHVRCFVCGRVGKTHSEPPDPKHVVCSYCFAEKWNPYLEAHPELQDLYEGVDPRPPQEQEGATESAPE
jgi:hypothetical protein